MDPSTTKGNQVPKQFKLTIFHDEGAESPFADDELIQFHSFSTRHINSIDPNDLFVCEVCGDKRDEFQHTDVEQVNDGDFKWADWAAEYRAENAEDLHEFVGPTGLMLSYFEHGLCRWGIAGTMSGMPDFRWDGTEFAGFLQVNLDDDNRSWWEGMTPEERIEWGKSACEVYTDWCNGEVYGYRLETRVERECDQGFTHEFTEELDSCWGFYGTDHLEGELREILASEGATAENTKIKDKAFGASSYLDFFKKALDNEPASL